MGWSWHAVKTHKTKLTLVAESPTVVDVRWLRKFQHPTRTPRMNGSILLRHASLTGFRTAVYTDLHVEYKRAIGARHNKRVVEKYGESFKKNGFSLWYVILVAIRERKLRYISGYLSSEAKCKDIQVASWNKKYQREKVLGRLGMKCSLLKNTKTARYVEPTTIP